ncbi:MAG: hypothetical protein ABW220_10480 [Burkholderiaceae bacterium]
MKAPALPIAAQRLIALARPLRATRHDEAAGCCLARCLEIAVEARARLGLNVALVRWTIVDDAGHLDHWAVRLDGERVIDPTHLQVDGRSALVWRIASYPENFTQPAQYPAALLIEPYRASLAIDPSRLTQRFMRTCAWRLFRADLQRARQTRDARSAMRACANLSSRLRGALLSAATRALQQRRAALHARLLCA